MPTHHQRNRAAPGQYALAPEVNAMEPDEIKAKAQGYQQEAQVEFDRLVTCVGRELAP